MNQIHYIYKKPKDTIFYQVAFLAIFGIYSYILVREIFSLIEVFSLKRLILLAVIFLIVIWIVYIISQIILMRKEYNTIDGGKEVIIKQKEQQLLIKQATVEKLIKNEEINSSEIFESWVAAYPLGYFKFIKLTLNSGEIVLITGFTLPSIESDLSDVLKGIKIKRHRRFINRIHNNYC